MNNRTQCPSEMWDDYMTQQEEAAAPTYTEVLEGLDAYGHMTYTIGFGEEGDERGDWLACLDFKVFNNDDGVVVVGYHAVVNSESGSFIETIIEDVGSLKEALGLADEVLDIGLSQQCTGTGTVTEKEIQDATDCIKRWKKDITRHFNSLHGQSMQQEFQRLEDRQGDGDQF